MTKPTSKKIIPISAKSIPIPSASRSAEAFAKKVIAFVRKSKLGLSLHDAIVKTSIQEGLNYHLGPYEYKKAEAAVIALICVAKPATLFDAAGNPKNARHTGIYNDILGKKIFPNANTKGKTPGWAGTAKAYRSTEKRVTGFDLPLVSEFERKRTVLAELGKNVPDSDWLIKKLHKPTRERDEDLQQVVADMADKLTMVTDISDLKIELQNLSKRVAQLAQSEAA